MAIISTIITSDTSITRIRSAVAQANVGQTDWIAVPQNVRMAIIYLNMTATSGTTPGPTTVNLRTVDPITLDAANALTLLNASGGLPNTGLYITEIGPNIRGGVDITTATRNVFHAILPNILGIKVVLDRTNGDETYTYTLDVEWKQI